MEIIYIVNPTAGNGKAKMLIPKIHEIMKDKNLSYQVIETTKKAMQRFWPKAVNEDAKK